MSPLLPGAGTRSSKTDAPRLVSLIPPAAMPGGEVELRGSGLLGASAVLPRVTVGDAQAVLSLSRPARAVIQIPEGTTSGPVVLERGGIASNALDLRVAVPMAEDLHPVANPAVDADGNVYATFSGARGQSVPVSIFSIARDFEMRPFVRGILNATGLAFDAGGTLYASSRAEGTVYRISPAGAVTTYAEGMGIATGIAFDRDGNLFVGDRSGTIFKVGPGWPAGAALQVENWLAENSATARSLSTPRSSPAWRPTIWRSTTRELSLSPGPPPPAIRLSTPSTATGAPRSSTRASAARRGWPSTSPATSTSPHRCMASAELCASRRGARHRSPSRGTSGGSGVSGRWLRRARHPRRALPRCLGHRRTAAGVDWLVCC